MLLVATVEQERGRCQVGVVNAIKAVLQFGAGRRAHGQVRLQRLPAAGQRIDANVVGLEERAQTIVILLRHRIVLMIVAAAALERDAEEGRADVFHGVLQPDGAIEDIEVAAEVTRCTLHVLVARRQFVAGEHLDDHPVVALVLVERLDDPVAPPPDVSAAVAQLVDRPAPVPVAVPPDIHPVPAPALAVTRTGQQFVHDLLVGVRRVVGEEGVQLVSRRRQADQVEVNPAEQHFFFGGRSRLQAALLMFGGNEGVDRIACPSRVFHSRNWGSHRNLVCPMLPRVFRNQFVRGLGALIDPRF